MKKLIYVLTILFVVTAYSQEKIYVEYEFRNEFDVSNVKDSKNKELYKNSNKNRLYFELLSSQKESIFKKIEKVDNSQNRIGASISFTSGPGGVFYKNFENKLSVSEISYNGKNLLINDSIKIKNWRLEKDKNKILGFDVKKATIKFSENSYVEAWYAPKLAIRNDPSDYDGLPGVILKLVISNKEGDQVNKEMYLATEVKLNDKIKIVQPKKGKNINKSDFEKLVEDDNKKFNETFMNSIKEKR